MSVDDLDRILFAFANGLSPADVGRQFGFTEDEARDALNKAIARTFDRLAHDPLYGGTPKSENDRDPAYESVQSTRGSMKLPPRR
jgi:hypothetical protein